MCVVLVCKGPPCHSSQYTSGWLYTGQLGGLSHTALQLHSDDQPQVYIWHFWYNFRQGLNRQFFYYWLICRLLSRLAVQSIVYFQSPKPRRLLVYRHELTKTRGESSRLRGPETGKRLKRDLNYWLWKKLKINQPVVAALQSDIHCCIYVIYESHQDDSIQNRLWRVQP